MKKKYFFTAVLLVVLITSCGINNKAYILKGNNLSYRKVNYHPLTKDSLFTFRVKDGFWSKVDVKEGYLILASIEDSSKKLDVPSISLVDQPNAQNTLVKESHKYYFPDATIRRGSFTYLTHKLVLQAMSISLKIRPQLDPSKYLDSFPSQAQAGFNPSLAIGYRLNYNTFKSSKDLFGNYTRQVSLTVGGFIGTGAVELNKNTTRTPTIIFPRTAPIFSTGGFVMLGYNNLHFGYSFGIDYAQGVGSSSWLYRGKLWHGITIGFDVIK